MSLKKRHSEEISDNESEISDNESSSGSETEPETTCARKNREMREKRKQKRNYVKSGKYSKKMDPSVASNTTELSSSNTKVSSNTTEVSEVSSPTVLSSSTLSPSTLSPTSISSSISTPKKKVKKAKVEQIKKAKVEQQVEVSEYEQFKNAKNKEQMQKLILNMQVKKQFIKDQSKKIQLQCVETVKPLIQGSKYDGLVFLGAGGDFEEWYTGIVNILEDEKCISSVLDFDQLYYFKNLNGRIDLVFPFARNNSIDIPRLAMWRLKAYSSLCPKWLSDYVDQV